MQKKSHPLHLATLIVFEILLLLPLISRPFILRGLLVLEDGMFEKSTCNWSTRNRLEKGTYGRWKGRI